MKKILYTDFALALVAALAILLGGCWDEIKAQPLPDGSGTKTEEPICDVDFTFKYDDANDKTSIIYNNLGKAGYAKVNLRKLKERGDINGELFDDVCLAAGKKQESPVTLENEMLLMVEIWRGKQCAPEDQLQPCYRNGAVIRVTHTPAKK